MSISSRYSKIDKIKKITCPNYKPIEGSKRCINYLNNGACSRPDENMCIEWLKVNAHKNITANNPDTQNISHQQNHQPPPSHIDTKVQVDLFGNPVKINISDASSKATESKPDLLNTENIPVVRNITDEDIASFKALNVEVCIRSKEIGDIWLVSEYTGKDRKEISVRDATTLACINYIFPGAKITSFTKQFENKNNSNKTKEG